MKLRSITEPTELIAAIGTRHPPPVLRQAPFDYDDAHLKRIVRTDRPTDLFDFADYFLDYSYMDVQVELFHFVLPRALQGWSCDLLDQDLPAHLTGEWNFEGMWEALHTRPPVPEFLSRDAGETMHAFIAEVQLERMSEETVLDVVGGDAQTYDWIYMHGTLMHGVPILERIWDVWWRLETRGHLICAAQWLSCLIFNDDDNPIFRPWTPEGGGGPIKPFDGADVTGAPPLPANVAFLKSTLSLSWVQDRCAKTAKGLIDMGRKDLGSELVLALANRSDVVADRLHKIPRAMTQANAYLIKDWDEIE